MASGKYRICLTCGKQYKHCGNCDASQGKEPWRNLYCSENCHGIWYTLSDFEEGFISKEEAKKKMENYNLSSKENWNQCVKDSYVKLFGITEKEGNKVEKPDKQPEPVKHTEVKDRVESTMDTAPVTTANNEQSTKPKHYNGNNNGKEVEKFQKIETYARQSFKNKK